MKPTLNEATREVEIDRVDFADWLKGQGDKRFNPAGSNTGDCFLSKYLLDNGIQHHSMFAFDEVRVKEWKDIYHLSNWAETFGERCSDESKRFDPVEYRLPASRALEILLGIADA